MNLEQPATLRASGSADEDGDFRGYSNAELARARKRKGDAAQLPESRSQPAATQVVPVLRSEVERGSSNKRSSNSSPPRHFTIYYQNIRGMRTKTEKLRMALMSSDYDVVVLTETWLHGNRLGVLRELQYLPTRNTATSSAACGGGALVAVKSDLEAREVELANCERRRWLSPRERVVRFRGGSTESFLANGLVQINFLLNNSNRLLDLTFVNDTVAFEGPRTYSPFVLKQLLNVLRDPVPVRVRRFRCPSRTPPWWNSQLRNLRNQLRKARKRFVNRSSWGNKVTLSYLETEFAEQQVTSYQNYIARVQDNLQYNPKNFWSYVKESFGSLIFVLFINYLCSRLQSCKLLYADDLKIFRRIGDSDDVRVLQEVINVLLRLCVQNGVEVNEKKCKLISFYRIRSPNLAEYNMGRSTLERVHSIVDLGVTIDCKMEFNQHVSISVAKSYAMLGFLRRNAAGFTDVRVFKTLYFSLIRSVLEYAVPVWAPY
ncbi:uncharacterized protein LOC120425620 [Culex pipiens pallens]|uniref:uncharacterized protein LOC120425620 n=1 Tax=Culex pipiens pallens TaxID=42434 RepID=UPI0022AA5039|nr:uncharacterized protein LOC120425620 [Culex pipiens pallens]